MSPTAGATGNAANLLNSARVALSSLRFNIAATPIGMLNLERLEMTPAGIQRGELIATIPLAPLEKTAVIHKEWSVTSKEFTSIVTDSLENVSETGITDNTELAQATTSETTHSNQLNINATVTGTSGFVTATTAAGFGAQDQNSASANESRKHAVATTRKASARVKQEHKVTISTTTVTGASETSTRVLENPSPTDPIRIDYFSLMRKWHVGLYRYGLRLTYDIAIPEPGAAMRKVYGQIAALQNSIGPFSFPVKHEDINDQNFLNLADQYDAQVPLPPPASPPITVSTPFPVTAGVSTHQLSFDVPTGNRITRIIMDARVTGPAKIGYHFVVLGTNFEKFAQPDLTYPSTVLMSHADASKPFLEHAVGRQTVTFFFQDATSAIVQLTIELEPLQDAIRQWQSDVWNALYNAAQVQYYAEQQAVGGRIAALQEQIANVDTLTLRREENEEIMKGVLRWILGPLFDFMPDDVARTFGQNDLQYGTAFTGNTGVTWTNWSPMLQYQEMVKFVNEAIEWENVLYFLYSYFWDVPPSWDFIRQIRHPDAMRQAFLRAGSARIVLTVRKGWETAWANFVEQGGFGQTLLPKHPYMTIASEIQNYDRTNYPGIPPANPGGGPLPDNGAYAATASNDALQPSAAPITILVRSSEGFLAGYTAIIDSWDNMVAQGGQTIRAQERQTITAVPDDTHITVERIEHPHDGSQQPFPILQAVEKGQLIAEWFEYTPTSGTDIAVTSNLATIA
jgi:hypothetical protein